MTREEASFYLANMDRKYMEEGMSEALDMAIKALEQEPCGDAISRADARHLIAETNRNALGYISTKVFKILYDGVDNLPSVTPQQRTGRWIERESGTEDKENGFETEIVCSYCDFPATTFYSEDCESRTQIRTHFCPNCGAKMQRR